MPIFARPPKQFEITPAGTLPAICVDVADIYEPDKFNDGKMRDAIELTFETEETNARGTQFWISKTVTNSLHEKAKAREVVEAWLNRALTPEEINHQGFDFESLIGRSCLLSVTHATSEKGVYAKVTAVTALPKGMAPVKASGTYVRKCDRPGYEPPKRPLTADAGDVPF